MARQREDASTEMARGLRRIGLALLAATALALFALWRVDNPRVERLRMGLADAVAPSMSAVARPVARVVALAADWERFSDVQAQNRELRREIERLRAWREAARALELENAQLRALNNVRLAPRLGFASGEVIADDAGPFSHSVLVNIGARDGVADGAAVVDGAGLVGRVVGVGDEVSRVLLLTDFDSRVPVKILPSGRRAVLTGDSTAAPGLRFLAATDGVAIGQRVVTSGDGGVFPPDLPIGVVAALGSRTARAHLFVDRSALEFVRVLRWRRASPAEGPVELILPQTPPADAAPRVGVAQ